MCKINEKITPNNIIPQHHQTMGSVSTRLWTHSIYTFTGSTLVALDTQDHVFFHGRMCSRPTFCFHVHRRYFGSSLGWSCSGLSAVPVGLRVVNPASCLRTSSFARSLSAAETMQKSILACFRDWLRRGSMHGCGSGKTKPCGGVRGACTQFT